MSTTPLDLPVLISQLPNLQQIMGPQHVPHEAQQVLFGQMVAENQRKEDQTVQVVDKEQGLDPMGRDSGGNKNSAHQPQPRKPRHMFSSDTDQQGAGSTQSSNASPWAGNIINVKI
jgi:hypothetical protein